MQFNLKIEGRHGKVSVDYSHERHGNMYCEDSHNDSGFAELHAKAFEECKKAYELLKKDREDV